ncbi:hypothetical protein [Streptomyces sp. NPDC048527]|uniref:hypothetical protein n=1 Tax=Streptomyces sp. NPDC048527 TaxID=3365568 RepID=UPI003713F792
MKNRPADLINIALEKVVEAGLELPGFTTLDVLAAMVRTEVNALVCVGIYDQGPPPVKVGTRLLITRRA